MMGEEGRQRYEMSLAAQAALHCGCGSRRVKAWQYHMHAAQIHRLHAYCHKLVSKTALSPWTVPEAENSSRLAPLLQASTNGVRLPSCCCHAVAPLQGVG